MPGESVRVHVEGLAELQRALSVGLFRQPATKFLDRMSIGIQSETIKQTPTDEGYLGNNIRRTVDKVRLFARVFTNVPYAKYVEKGTRPHWPPISAVSRWARLHGIPPFLVARSIARYGTSKGARDKRGLGGSTGPWGYGMFELGERRGRRMLPGEMNRMWSEIRRRFTSGGGTSL